MPTKQKTGFDSGLIRQLAEIMADNGLTEIELQEGESNLRLSRMTTVVAAPAAIAAPAPVAQTPAAAPAAAPAPAAAAEPAAEDHPGAVKSPMVGTVYLAPQPGADPFFKAGDSVSEGDTLMIIEAMKVMNPLPAPRSGTIKAILVKDSQPVEFGDPLVIIE